MNSKATYEAIWERKQAASGQQGAADPIPPGSRTAIALELVGAGERVLDVGCGDGVLGAALLRRFSEAHGVDISATAVARACSLGVDAVQVNLDAEPLPYLDGLFSAVTCLDVLEHVFDPRVLIREMARVCAPGGTLVITTPNIRYWKHILSIFGGRFPWTSSDEEGYDGGHLHYYTAANLIDLLNACFTVQRVQGVKGGARRGGATTLFSLLLPGRLGDEFASPGIAIAATRREGVDCNGRAM